MTDMNQANAAAHRETLYCEGIVSRVLDALWLDDASTAQKAQVHDLILLAREDARSSVNPNVTVEMPTKEFVRELVGKMLQELAEGYGMPGANGVGLREGRPEHLTVEEAERHADRLREMNPTVVGKLLILAVDALREERENHNKTYNRLLDREGMPF